MNVKKIQMQLKAIQITQINNSVAIKHLQMQITGCKRIHLYTNTCTIINVMYNTCATKFAL